METSSQYFEIDRVTGAIAEVHVIKKQYGAVTFKHLSDALSVFNMAQYANAPVIFPVTKNLVMLVNPSSDAACVHEIGIMWPLDKLIIRGIYSLRNDRIDSFTKIADPETFYITPDFLATNSGQPDALITTERTVPFGLFKKIKLLACVFWRSNKHIDCRCDMPDCAFLALATWHDQQWHLNVPFLPNIYTDSKLCFGANVNYSNYCDSNKPWSPTTAAAEFENFLNNTDWNSDLYTQSKEIVVQNCFKFNLEEDKLFDSIEKTEENLLIYTNSYYSNYKNYTVTSPTVVEMFKVLQKFFPSV